MLNVVTLNLLNDLSRWSERAPLIVDELRRLQPDLIALQEVVLPGNTAQWIADELDGYSVHLSPKTGRLRDREGLAILSRLPVQSHASMALGNQNRVAQMVTLRNGSGTWAFANAHMYWNPVDDLTRLRQVRRLLNWLPGDVPVVVCGDFNAEPNYPSMAAMRERFVSAHYAAHGYEPLYTCPTPLHRGRGPRHSMRRGAIRVLGHLFRHEDRSWKGTIDFIYVDRGVSVRHCAVAFDRAAGHDAQLYPSDHLGLSATVEVPQ